MCEKERTRQSQKWRADTWAASSAALCVSATWRRARSAAAYRACTCFTKTALMTGSSATAAGTGSFLSLSPVVLPCGCTSLHLLANYLHLHPQTHAHARIHAHTHTHVFCSASEQPLVIPHVCGSWQPGLQDGHLHRGPRDSPGGWPGAVLGCGYARRAGFSATWVG